MIERDTLLITSIKCEFNIPATTTEYNIWAQFLTLLTLFKRQDKTVRIQAHNDGRGEWNDFTTLPEDDLFVKSFGLVTREFRNHKKVIVHCNVVSSRPFNNIKYAADVKNHISLLTIYGSRLISTSLKPKGLRVSLFAYIPNLLTEKSSLRNFGGS